jgi:hypothetical protein
MAYSPDNVYTENGFKNRRDYLEQLASEYDMTYAEVQALADLLGPDEDFNGLVSSLQDYAR